MSKFADTLFGAQQEWKMTDLKLISPSEHTLDAQQFDLEVRMNFKTNAYKAGLSEKKVKDAAVIFFMDRDNATVRTSAAEKAAFGTAFWLLMPTDAKDKVYKDAKFFNLRDIMNILNFDERWVYRGSGTTPPCAEGVYTNVLRTVYPLTDD